MGRMKIKAKVTEHYKDRSGVGVGGRHTPDSRQETALQRCIVHSCVRQCSLLIGRESMVTRALLLS